MASDRNEVTLRDLLYELAIDADDPQALRRLMDEHPEHADALVQYARDLAADGDLDDESEDANEERIDQLANPAMSRYQNHLYDQKHGSEPAAQSKASTASDPFSALSPKEFRALAGRLDVNSLFLTKVRDCVIKPDTIPKRFSQRTAEALGIPHPVVIAHLAQQPRAPPGTRWRADEKPKVGAQQTWEEAVRSSSLTKEQQDQLLGP